MKPNSGTSKALILDRELLFALRQSSTLRQKIAEIFELLRDPVYRYLFRVLENTQEAEDLTQEVFLRLYTYLDTGHSVGNIRAWVFRVAHNLAIDQQRRKVILDPLDIGVVEKSHDPAPGVEQRLLEAEQYQRLESAITQLSAQEKHCLELRAEGLSYQEIAEIFEMRLPTLVKYLGRIIRKLVNEVTYD
jgi:RNA polymerase sigma-70 factor (ECF subfamily)